MVDKDFVLSLSMLGNLVDCQNHMIGNQRNCLYIMKYMGGTMAKTAWDNVKFGDTKAMTPNPNAKTRHSKG